MTNVYTYETNAGKLKALLMQNGDLACLHTVACMLTSDGVASSGPLKNRPTTLECSMQAEQSLFFVKYCL